jgi:hypothetical protein
MARPIAEVYNDAATDYADIKAASGSILDSALTTIGKQVNTQGKGQAVLIFNPLAWERAGLVSLDSVLLRRAQALYDFRRRRALRSLSA